MQRLFAAALAALFSVTAFAATLNPVQLLNPAGSTAGQAVVSTGPSTAPGWGNATASGLTPVGSNTVIANATASSASPTALAVPSCSGTSNALLWTTNTGFACNSAINASALGGATFASPSAIGSTAPNSGAFTTLSASSTVTGAGFSTYLASPPAIGGTSPNTGSFTTLSANTGSTTTAATFTTSSSGSTLKIVDTGTSGANFAMFGNGGTTPNKFLRALNGSFGVVNSAYTTQVLTLTDGGNLSVTGSIAPSTTAGIVGTTTNDNANAGAVGEFICAQVTNGGSPTGCATNSSTPVSLSSNTPANVTSLSLSAGDWDCRGNVLFNNGGTTVTTQSTGSINTTSATTNPLQFANYSPPNTAGLNPVFTVPTVRESLSATTTVYLVVNNVFSTSTSAAYGRIDCRRAR